jgi:hypothetical protein
VADIREFLLARISSEDSEARTAKAEFAHGGFGCFGPDRVLAECTAKRVIIEQHGPGDNWYREYCETCADWEDAEIGEGPPNIEFPCPTLRAVAAVYAGHPDYQQEWAA